MVSASLSIALLLALVPIGLVAAGDKEDLYAELFAKDAPVADTQRVLNNLNRIQRYLPKMNENLDEVDSAEVQNLIDASVLSDDRCKSFDEFKKVFLFLADRQNFKKDEAGVKVGFFEGHEGVTAWNENILNYITTSSHKQLEACAGSLKEAMEKVTEEEKQILDETSVFAETFVSFGPENVDKMAEAFSAKLKAKSVPQKNIEKEAGKLLAKVEAACKSVNKNGESFRDLFEQARIHKELKSQVDEQTSYWVDRLTFCHYILNPVRFTYHGTLKSRIQHGEYVLPRLVRKISSTY